MAFRLVELPILISLCVGQGAPTTGEVCTFTSQDALECVPPVGESLLQKTASKHRRANVDKAAGSVRGEQLFYHFHVPRTGGTTVANLLVADLCQPYDEKLHQFVGWSSYCTLPCPQSIVDNELTCQPGADPERKMIVHSLFSTHQKRAASAKRVSGAKQIVYVMTLRKPSDRVVSQWMKESFHGGWQPPPGVAKLSDESLRLYLTTPGSQNPGKGWIAAASNSQRNNLHVGMLASLDQYDAHRAVTKEDLETAKRVLTHGAWIIGFTECLEQLHLRLEKQASFQHHGNHHKELVFERPEKKQFDVDINSFNKETLDLLHEKTAIDNELYKWAWGEASKKNASKRWAGTC
jgi:hypothetical protein